MLVGSGKLKVRWGLTFPLLCHGVVPRSAVAPTLSPRSTVVTLSLTSAVNSLLPAAVPLLWVNQKSLMWCCFRITFSRNHVRANGNKFPCLLGWLPLAHLHFWLNGPASHPAALWEFSMETCGGAAGPQLCGRQWWFC